VKFGFVAKHRGIWPAEWLCGALGVSRGGFYAWLTRPRSRRSRSDEDVGAKVRASFLASDRTYGARRVWHDLLADGVSCGLHRIERLMRQQALKARPRRRRLPPDLGERQVVDSDSTGEAGESAMRVGSAVNKARETILRRGKPVHINELLVAVGKEVTRESRASLTSSIAAYVRRGEIFTRPAPNTFGLVELGHAAPAGGAPQPQPPQGFGKVVQSPDPKISHDMDDDIPF
jgi:hypothetical protein